MNPKIILKRNKEESLLRFHPWIFSGAIAASQGNPEEGDLVDVYTCDDKFIARGHCQIGSISVRVLTFRQETIDRQWWLGRLHSALELRRALSLTDDPKTDCYRLVHGEGDGLPGLIIDIYGTCAVIQCHSIGMYLTRELIAECIVELYAGTITMVYDKSSQTIPRAAGLDARDRYLFGNWQTPEYTVTENGHSYLVNWQRGQKTGFFLDQRENRALVERFSAGRSVLNTFCYTGGFSVSALAGGAERVVSLDSSAIAVETAVRNVELNFGSQDRHMAVTDDAMEYLKRIGPEYDMIILDPPAFAKHRGAIENALQGYKRLNARAIKGIRPGGLIFTFSCSQAINPANFRNAVFSAAAIAGRNVRILQQLSQPGDHPVNIYHPEGDYLKGLILYVE